MRVFLLWISGCPPFRTVSTERLLFHCLLRLSSLLVVTRPTNTSAPDHADSRCDGSRATRGFPRRDHEDIASLCARTPGFDIAENEASWAVSEVGEGIEELWEYSVSSECGQGVSVGQSRAAACDWVALPRVYV